MPTYSYRCTACETAFDIHQAFTEDSLTVCPTCGGSLRKVFSAVGVTFSGSGFYSSDNRAAEKNSSAKSSSASKPSPATPTPAATPAASTAPAAGSAT